ncbi:MAG: methylase domain protein [Frankiales bacterium]|nr:methylase domain protein [Frankiales bacterium]
MTEFSDKQVVYSTALGSQVCGDSLELLAQMADESVDLIVTSPPFALLRAKKYGNEDQADYIAWLAKFGEAAHRVLKPTGSLVIDLGGAYVKGRPTRSLYQYRVLLKFVDDLGYHLAEEFFWYNPSKLPSPIEWVNKQRIRVKDAVNTVWWLSKTERPKADVNQVLVPYSARMNKLLENPAAFYDAKARPSEHDISMKFGRDNGGAIPTNLLTIPNTDSNSGYLRTARALDIRSHPARFPEGLPEFFIKFLTEPGDLVVDIFAGSNTTGMVAERLGRRWLGFELDREYAALSILRFVSDRPLDVVRTLYDLAQEKWIDLTPSPAPSAAVAGARTTSGRRSRTKKAVVEAAVEVMAGLPVKKRARRT